MGKEGKTKKKKKKIFISLKEKEEKVEEREFAKRREGGNKRKENWGLDSVAGKGQKILCCYFDRMPF